MKSKVYLQDVNGFLVLSHLLIYLDSYHLSDQFRSSLKNDTLRDGHGILLE